MFSRRVWKCGALHISTQSGSFHWPTLLSSVQDGHLRNTKIAPYLSVKETESIRFKSASVSQCLFMWSRWTDKLCVDRVLVFWTWLRKAACCLPATLKERGGIGSVAVNLVLWFCTWEKTWWAATGGIWNHLFGFWGRRRNPVVDLCVCLATWLGSVPLFAVTLFRFNLQSFFFLFCTSNLSCFCFILFQILLFVLLPLLQRMTNWMFDWLVCVSLLSFNPKPGEEIKCFFAHRNGVDLVNIRYIYLSFLPVVFIGQKKHCVYQRQREIYE